MSRNRVVGRPREAGSRDDLPVGGMGGLGVKCVLLRRLPTAE